MSNIINKKNTTIFLIISLFISIFIIQIFYLALINPLSFEYMSYAQSNNISPPRHFSVVLKDPEQKLCLILFLWSLLVGIFYTVILDREFLAIKQDNNILSILSDDVHETQSNNNDVYKTLI